MKRRFLRDSGGGDDGVLRVGLGGRGGPAETDLDADDERQRIIGFRKGGGSDGHVRRRAADGGALRRADAKRIRGGGIRLCRAAQYERTETADSIHSDDGENGSGRALHEERYVSHLPGVVEPNGTLLVSEWMYDFTKDIGKVASIDITVETDTRAYERWNRLDGVRAWQEGQYLYVELTNTTEETLFGAVCGATLETADGQILDMMLQSSYETMDVGIAPKSTVVWRKRLEDGATLKLGADTVCEAWAYRVETY